MPIEIKELHIRITVNEGAKDNSSSNKGKDKTAKIIETCVEEVMEILKNHLYLLPIVSCLD